MCMCVRVYLFRGFEARTMARVARAATQACLLAEPSGSPRAYVISACGSEPIAPGHV
jgi:hypothetical protein